MNQPHNSSEAIDFAIAQNWLVIILVVVVPIVYAILMKKFETWAEKKIKSLKKKKVKRK
jgi:hypothetical protein